MSNTYLKFDTYVGYRCQVKMTGDMMVSFPAGIIQVFASNPMPAQLTCKVRSKQPLDNLVSNKDLVKV